MRRTWWIAGGLLVAAGLVWGVTELARVARHTADRNAARFALECETAGFAPGQCAFLAAMDRRTSAASDDAAIANLNASNAGLVAAARR